MPVWLKLSTTSRRPCRGRKPSAIRTRGRETARFLCRGRETDPSPIRARNAAGNRRCFRKIYFLRGLDLVQKSAHRSRPSDLHRAVYRFEVNRRYPTKTNRPHLITSCACACPKFPIPVRRLARTPRPRRLCSPAPPPANLARRRWAVRRKTHPAAVVVRVRGPELRYYINVVTEGARWSTGPAESRGRRRASAVRSCILASGVRVSNLCGEYLNLHIPFFYGCP